MSSQEDFQHITSEPVTAPPSSDSVTEPPPSSSSPSHSSQNAIDKPPNPRLTALQNKHANLTAKLAELQQQRATIASQTTLPLGLPLSAAQEHSADETLKLALKSSDAVIKEHIALLHRYNEIKDIGQGLMGLIAEKRGCRIKDVIEEFGVDEGD